MESKYGEPWNKDNGLVGHKYDNGSSEDFATVSIDHPKGRWGVILVKSCRPDIAERIALLGTVFAGIPDEELPNVLKAYVGCSCDGAISDVSISSFVDACKNNPAFAGDHYISLLDNLKNVSAK